MENENDFLALMLLVTVGLTAMLGQAGEIGRQVLAHMVAVGVLTETPVVAIPGTAVGLDGSRLLILLAALIGLVTLGRVWRRRGEDETDR